MQYVYSLFLIAAVSCGGTTTLATRWNVPEHPVNVDGLSTEWEDQLEPAKTEQLLAGIRNDGDYLYVCLVPINRQLGIQMLLQGFTVWFDSTARHEKVMGLKYPVGGRPEWNPEKPKTGEFDKQLLKRLSSMELLRPKIFGQERISVGDLPGVDVHVRVDQERLVYEIRFPLQDRGLYPYFVGTKPGKWISLGLELNAFKRPDRGGNLGEAGAGRPGGPPLGSTSNPSRRGARIEPGKFEVWIKAKLAASDTNKHL